MMHRSSSQNCIAGDEFCDKMRWSQNFEGLPSNSSQNCIASDEFCDKMRWSQNFEGLPSNSSQNCIASDEFCDEKRLVARRAAQLEAPGTSPRMPFRAWAAPRSAALS